MLDSCEDLRKFGKLFDKPVLVFIAGKEKVVNNDSAKFFFNNCGSKDKTLRLYPNAYHNIHKEPEYKLRQFAEIYEFIHERIGKIGPFDLKDLDNIKYGRKRRTAKVKRSLFKVSASVYFILGFLAILLMYWVRK
jgi:hypothetical protein